LTSDPDIFRAAKLLIDQHGADVGLPAAERADQLFEDGDVDDASVWVRILNAIEDLGHSRMPRKTLSQLTLRGPLRATP